MAEDDESMGSERLPGFWATAVVANGNLKRAIVLLLTSVLLVGGALTVLALVIASTLKDKSFDLAYSFDENKVLFASHGSTVVYTALPASAGWTKTGVHIPPGKTVTIKAVGHVHLALKELQLAIDEDRRPLFPWYEPAGLACTPPTEGPDWCQLSIYPGQGMGMLLAYLKTSSTSEPPSFRVPRPSGIQAVGAQGTITNNSKEEADLYLAVNDIVLEESEKAHEIYLAGVGPDDIMEREQQWKKIVAASYWNIWFDDNVGQYFVQIEAKP